MGAEVSGLLDCDVSVMECGTNNGLENSQLTTSTYHLACLLRGNSPLNSSLARL